MGLGVREFRGFNAAREGPGQGDTEKEMDVTTDTDKVQELVLLVERVNSLARQLAVKGYRVDLGFADVQSYQMAYQLNLVKVDVLKPMTTIDDRVRMMTVMGG